MDDLRSCPLCDGEALGAINSRDRYFVYCAECGHECPTQPTKDVAITAWNRQPRVSKLIRHELRGMFDPVRIIRETFSARPS